jgi:RNA polymerase sigma-70 factor (ECF subfamily)
MLLPRVRRWVYRFAGPSSFSDDVVQDALIEIARALPRFRGDAALETFSYRITIRVASRALRKRNRQAAILQVLPPAPDSIDPRSYLADRELVRRLYEALDKLSTQKRAVFVLCAIEGFSPGEAAEILESKPATVRSQLRRARNQLSKLIDGGETLSLCPEHSS